MKQNEKRNRALRFRPFRKGSDEQIWVDIANAVYADDPDWGGATVGGMIEGEKSPSFRLKGRFIVEYCGRPVGIVNAETDKLRDDKKGFVHAFGVLPGLDRDLEEDMARFAISNLKHRGMRSANFWIYEKRRSLKLVLQRLGFKHVRTHSTMEISLLKKLPKPGPSPVEMRPLNTESSREVEELTRLQNECFKEEHDYRPRTVEEMRYSLVEDPYLKKQQCFFALKGTQKIGYIRIGIDQQYNREKNVKAGFIPAFGVLEHHRRKGVGTRLLLKALETLRERGMQKAQLGVDDLSPTMAKRLYEAIGFRTISKYSAYEKGL